MKTETLNVKIVVVLFIPSFQKKKKNEKRVGEK